MFYFHQRKSLLILIIIISVGVFFSLWWFSTPQVLKRKSQKIIQSIEMDAGTSRMQRSLKINQLSRMLAETLTVTYPPKSTPFHRYGFQIPIHLNRNKIKTALLYLTETAEWITINDIETDLTHHNKKEATVHIAFTMDTKLKRRNEQRYPLVGTFTFQKKNSDWLLSQVTFKTPETHP